MKMQQIQIQEKKGRAYRPLLSIEPVVKLVSRKFEIKETAADLITQYAKFMSEQSGQTVKEDSVVESLAGLILGDKGFKEWAGKNEDSRVQREGN